MGQIPSLKERRNGLPFGKLLPSEDTSNQLANGTLKDLGDQCSYQNRSFTTITRGSSPSVWAAFQELWD